MKNNTAGKSFSARRHYLKSSSFGLLLLLFWTLDVKAQSAKAPIYNSKNGVGITTADSLFSLNFRFRTQLRTGYTTVSKDDLSAKQIEARVRRLRLRFEGFMLSPKLTYYLQLSFSRGDMDWLGYENSVVNSSPNIVRDAVITYNVSPQFSFMFGQTKLPGNRQRVVSSGQLQFPDRSIVNDKFNIDRDFGLQFAYKNKISTVFYILKGAISSGEGRNSLASDGRLAYTGRIEVLPFGEFTNQGDYFEGDLEREKKFKLSAGGGYHYNDGAMRNEGTTGMDLYEQRNISTAFADILMKYRGAALSSEYMNRNTNSPITVNEFDDERIIFVGEGINTQLSYLFKNNIEIAGRYAIVSPYNVINQKALQTEEMGFGLTKYLNKHKVKLQGQFLYYRSRNLFINETINGQWNVMFQIELGI